MLKIEDDNNFNFRLSFLLFYQLNTAVRQNLISI